MSLILDREQPAEAGPVRGTIADALGWALALWSAWAVTLPFRSHRNWMYYQQDDFFYYLKVAQNLAAGHGSTFNQIVPTNGYHPLWVLLLTIVLRAGAGPHGLMVFLAITIWAAITSTYLLSRLLLRRSGLDSLTASTLAFVVAVYASHLYMECMEVTLALPCLFGFLIWVQAADWWGAAGAAGWKRSVLGGLLASTMILARLDTAIFAAIVGVSVALQPDLRRRVGRPQAAGLATGLLPVMCYLALNRIVFDLWMPVSGMAKQLKLDHGFTSKAWRTMLPEAGILNLAAILLAAATLPWLWRRLRPEERGFTAAALVFPFLYFAILSWLSDWRVWGWYFYGLRPALCVAFLILLRSARLRHFAARPAAVALLILFTVVHPGILWDEQMPQIVDAAIDVKAFAATHPGVYAMGDRSGAVGYLLPYPLVQTEGLVMDRKFLALIAKQTPLRTALAPYRVRYYVASSWTPYSGCFHATEPYQAGPHAPHMRDVFCQEPLARWTHDGIETIIFDLADSR